MHGQQSDLDALMGQMTARVAAAGLEPMIEIRTTEGRPEAALEGGTAEFVLRLAGRYEEADEIASLAAAGDWTGYIDRVIEVFGPPARG